MDLDALKKFIEDKGNQRKKDLYDACIFQTLDAEKTKILSDKIQKELDLARGRDEAFKESLVKYENEKEEAAKTIEESKAAIQAKEDELASNSDDPAPYLAKAKEIYETLADSKNKKGNMEAIVKLVNETLNNHSPGMLVVGLEHFVALLRNSRSANNVDVELFFKDAQKLTTKLRRMEASTLKYDNVKIHRDELASVKGEFADNPRPAKDEVNLGPFAPLIEWGVQFATGAEMILKVEKTKQDIRDLEEAVKTAELVIKRNETILEDIEEAKMGEYYSNQVINLEERKLIIDKIKLQDQEQAVDYQKKLFNFEKVYFEKLLELVKNQ